MQISISSILFERQVTFLRWIQERRKKNEERWNVLIGTSDAIFSSSGGAYERERTRNGANVINRPRRQTKTTKPNFCFVFNIVVLLFSDSLIGMHGNEKRCVNMDTGKWGISLTLCESKCVKRSIKVMAFSYLGNR